MEFVSKNWTYIVAFFSVAAYLLEKFYNFWIDRKKKQEAYNRIFVAIVKLFYSYQKHKNLYAEKPSINLPDEVYSLIVKHIDTFDNDLEYFKESIIKESEIIPEISIESHLLFELSDRILILDIMGLVETVISEMTNEQKLMAKRAQFYSLEKVFDEFFENILEKVRKRADVKKEFMDKLSYFGTLEYEIENFNFQKEIAKKYLDSLYRQGAISKVEFDGFSSNIINESKSSQLKID
jgi:hypothetical protein